MTEAELLENAGIQWANFLTTFVLSITILSGYLIAAYAVGASLTRSQVILVNVIFFGTMAFIIVGLNGFGGTAADLRSRGVDHDNPAYSCSDFLGPLGCNDICSSMCFGALKFMWDVRHPKDE